MKKIFYSYVNKTHFHKKGFALRACLHGGGGPKVGEVTRLGGVSESSDLMDTTLLKKKLKSIYKDHRIVTTIAMFAEELFSYNSFIFFFS